MSISVTTRRMSASLLTGRRSPLCACLVLLACLLLGCSDGDNKRQQLQELQLRNQSDSLMTDDSLATALCHWFDRHGTPNERMLAHYLMGRTWADKGEAPQALDEYHTAADCADTTATDCDYRLLCRVYSQMGDVFYRQHLMRHSIDYLNVSIAYAYKGGDTLAAINSDAYKMNAYKALQQNDSVISIFERIYKQLLRMGYRQRASQYCVMAFDSYLEMHKYEKVKHFINVYETESGYFDSIHAITPGREVYYFFKGRYFLYTQQYDSAEYYFRKEISEGKDFNNQNGGALGLSQLFLQTHRPDSAAKYAIYSYQMNDSCYVQKETGELSSAESMYNYGRYIKIAEKEKETAERQKKRSRVFFVALVIAVSFAFFIVYRMRKRRKEEQLTLSQKTYEIDNLQDEIRQLKTHTGELDCLIEKKEKKMQQLIVEISGYHRRIDIKDKDVIENNLKKSTTYKSIQTKANQGKLLTEDDWHQIKILLAEILPDFYQFISTKHYYLSDKEYYICILLRLNFGALSISNMLGLSPSYITKISKQVLEKMFNCSGTSKNLQEKLCKYC